MQSRIEELVDAELVKRTYGLLPIGLLATVVNSGLIALLHWNLVPRIFLVSWFGLLFLISLARILVWLHFRTRRSARLPFNFYRRVMVAGAGATGILWGSAAFFRLFHASFGHEMLVVLVLGGMAAGSAATFSFFRSVYYWFAIPALTPQFVSFLIMGDPIHLALAGMVTLFTVLVSVSAQENSNNNRTGFRLRFEREEMLANLSEEKGRTEFALEELRTRTAERERAQQELRAAHAGLEETVKKRTAELAHTNQELVREIKERELAEAALRRSEELYRTIVDTAQEGIWLIGRDHRILYANDRIAELLGCRAENLARQRVERYMNAHDAEFYGSEHPRGIRELRLFKRDGQEVCTLEAVSRLPAALDREEVTLAMLTDITSREEWEREIVKLNQRLQETNSELSAFAHSVSHDLRSPLRSIEGLAEALAEDSAGCLDETGQEYLTRLRNSAKRMKELIDDLLSLSRVSQSGLHRAPADLTWIAEDIIKVLRARDPARNVTVVIETGLTANCDPRLLRIALENLFDNAWKFTARARLARIQFGVLHEERGTVFYVADTGAGFNMAFAGRLFKPFQRLHLESDYPGTGVGLATVARVIHRHGGDIWVESEPGRGTTFYFTLEAGVALPNRKKGRIEPNAAALTHA